MAITIDTKVITNSITDLNEIYKYYSSKISDFSKTSSAKKLSSTLDAIRSNYKCIAENTLTISNFLVDFYNDINALEFKMSNSGNASISVSSVASIVSKTFNSIEKSSILYDKIFDNIELVSFTETGVTVEGLSDLSMYNFSEEQINALLLNLDTNKPLTKEESKFLTDYYNNILVVQKQKAVAEVEIARDAYDKLKSIEKELMGYDYNINSIETAILNAKEMGDYETLEKLENIIQKSGFKDLASYEQAVDAAYQNLQIKNAQLHAIEKSLKQQSYLFAMREKEYQDFKPNNVVNKEAISSMIVFDEASNTFSIDYKAYCNKYGNVDPFTFLKIVKEQNQYAIPINIKESDLLERLSKASTSSTFQEDYSNYYVYLYETQGVDSALEYLNAIEEDINRYCGELDAKEFFDSLADLNDEESRLLAINNHLRTTTQGLGLGAIGSLENIGYLMEGIFSSNENRIYSDLEYQMMYISQGLASEEDKINAGLITKGADGKVISVPGLIDYTADYGKFLDINFNLSQNIGNMLPSMVMSTVTGGIAGTNQLAQLFAATLSKGTFGLSAAGGSFHTAMVEGHDKNLSLLYGAISGSSEILTESLLGSLPFMNDVNVVGFKTFMKASLQEGFEEFVQEYLDAAVRTFTFNDRYLKDELFDNACVSFMYGMASGGIMNSGKLVSNVLSSQNVKNQIAAGNITQEQLVSEFHNQFKDSLEMDFNAIMKNNTKAAEAVGMQLVEKNGKTKAEGPIKSALSGLGVLGLGTSFFGGSSNGNGSTSNSSSSSNNNSTVRRNTAINNRNKTTSSKSENKTDSKDSLTSQREQLLRDNPGLKELNDRANLGVAVNVSSDLSDAFSRLRQLDSQIKKNEIDLTKVKQVNSDFKDAKTISDVENIISLKLDMKQILNAETVKLLPKALLGAIDMLGFLGAHFKYDSVLKSDAMVQKIVNDGLYHITSMENVQKILDSGYVKAGNVISSYGNKKSFFFAGTPGVGDVASNIGNFLDKHVAVKFDIDKSQVSDFRYRSLGDQAVTYDGNFNFLPSQAHLVYLGMVYENGKLAYKEISKSEFDNYESLIGKNKIENLKLNLQNLVLGYAFEYNNTIKRINLIKDAFSDASIKNAMANLSKSFSSLLGSKMDTDMSIAYATEGVGNSSIDSMINEYNSIIDNNPEVRKMLVVGASIGDVSSDIMQQYMRASFLETQILKSDTHANQTKNLQSLKSKLSDAKLVLQNTLGNIKNKLFEFNQVKNTTPFAKLIQEVNLKESTQTVRDLKNTILESMPNELSPIEKARWAYIELGKMLNFDENLNSNPEKMYAQVYNKHYEITDDSIIKNNKVICTSWSKIYGDILTSLGIENIVQGEKGSHQWVEFKVNDVYIYADATTGGYSNPQDLAKIHLGEATTNFKPIYHFSEGKYIPHQVYSEGSGSFDNILSVIDQNIKYIKDGYDIARTSIEFNENDSISDKLQKLSQTAKLNTLGFVEGKSFLLNFVKNLSDTEKSKVSGCDFSKILADGDVELVNVTAVQLDDGNYKYFAFHEGVGFTPVTSHDIDMLIRDGFKMAEGKGLSGYKFNQIRSIRDSLLEKAFPLSFAKQYLLNETKNFTSLLKNDTLNIASKTNAFVKNHNLSNFQNSIKTILNQKITNSILSKFLPNLSHLEDYVKTNSESILRVADIDLENVQTKSTNGNTVNTSNFEKFTIKDLPFKTQKFISKLAQNSDYLSLKAFTESLIYGYKNGDESTKKVIENIDTLDKLSQVPNLYLADTLEIEKSSFSDNNRFLHNNKMFITNEVGNDFQIIAHEIGHMLLNVIDNTTLPDNFDTIITKIQNNWSQDSSRLLSFLNEARDYKETLWTKSVEMGEQYAKEQDANFNEHIKQLYEDNVELEKELSKAATTYDISDMELQRMMRENDYEAISKLLKRYYVNLYISEDFTYRSNNDSSMQIYDVVAGLIDSVYNGNNPYYSTIYDNGFLRSHTSNYYKKKNTNSFDEQFADFTRMKLYDMQAVEIITKELLGNEWFLMMDEKFAQIANKMENHETSYEVSNKSILDTVFQNISFNSENSFRDVNLENISKKTNTFISNHTSSNLFSKFSNLYKEFVGKVSLKFKTLWSGNSSKIESRYLNILHEYEMLLEQNPNLYSSLKEYYTNPSSFKNKNDVQLNRLIYLNNQLHSLSSTIINNSFSEEVITKDMVSKAIDSHITDAATQQFLLNKLSRIIEKNPSSIAISFQDPKQYIISKFPAMAVRNNQNSSFYQDYLAYLHKTSSLSVNEISFSEVYNTFSKYMTAYERIVLNDLVTSTNSAFHNYTDVQKSAISFYTKISGPMLTAFLRKAVITFSSLKSSSQYDGTNINKIEDLLNRSFQYWENKQIASIKNNVSSYKNIFTNVNSFVKIMDSLFKNAPSLKEDTTVYRVVDGLYHNGKQLLSYDIGTIFRDNAFLSTTLVDGSFGQKDFTKIKLKIEIPKGTQAVYMEQFTGVQNYTQQELLLNRGTSLQIVGDLYLDESNHYVLPVRVVNPEFSRMGIDSFEDTSSIDAYFKENYSSLANQKSLSQVVSYMKENGLNLKFEKQIETLKQQKVYDFQNAEHGFEHIRNVLFYAMYMGEKMNLTSQEKKILTAACAYHDSGLKFTTHASEHGKVGAQIIEHYLDSSYSRYEMKMIQAAILYHEMEDTKDNFQYVLQTYGILEQDVNSLYRICSILKDADAIDSVRFPGNLNPTKLRNDISKTLIQASYQMQNIRAKNILNTKIEKNQYNKKSLDSISLLKSKGVSDYLIYMYIENSWYQKTYKELTNLLNRKE